MEEEVAEAAMVVEVISVVGQSSVTEATIEEVECLVAVEVVVMEDIRGLTAWGATAVGTTARA